MKLLYCNECGDVVKLKRRRTYCDCEKNGGMYHRDGLLAVYWGESYIPLGISNSSFVEAWSQDPHRDGTIEGFGTSFEAFTIPKDAPTVYEFPNEESASGMVGRWERNDLPY